MGLSSTVSKINGNFDQKLQFFPPQVHLNPPLKVFSLEMGTDAWCQKLEWWPRKKFDDIFSRLDTIHESDGQTDRLTDWLTDGRTDTGWQQRPRLRIASRGKNRKMDWFLPVIISEIACMFTLVLIVHELIKVFRM